MATFIIKATVDTVSLRTRSDGTWHGSVEVPEFKVDADDRYEAVALAEEIIDPLHMTDTHVTATEEKS